MHRYRTHTCADLRATDTNTSVRLSGWVHRIRDHGGVLFVDLRDHYGITQIVADPDSPVFHQVEALRNETCICIDGIVKERDPDLINDKLDTGAIEVFAQALEILGDTGDLPLPVFAEPDFPEDVRLRYRFLDLRRETLQRTMILRSQVIAHIRQLMWQAGFHEFQTPILTASSPEGARDFLVPSRLHPGHFYALPQAPQQFKQLTMIAGFDKYFQIAPCFRDEDPRADRSPTDFYQLDMEMSFVTQNDVFATLQPILQAVFERFGGGYSVDRDWPRLSFAEAMVLYGTDKPDLRNPIKMCDVSDVFRDSNFAVFARLLETPHTQIRAIPAPTGGARRFCDRMNGFAQKAGLPGMGYIFWRANNGECEAAGPLANNLGAKRCEDLRNKLGLTVGDAAFFLGGQPTEFQAFAASARMHIAQELNLIDQKRFAFAWIVDFPMYEKTPEGTIEFSHNPFSMPQGGLEALENTPPLHILGQQYDLACNGYELTSGAIRNHIPAIMFKAFAIAGYTENEVRERFGGMVNALSYGAPPHGGSATGLDRLVMLLAGAENIREVIMFPMNQRGEDLLLGAPSKPSAAQLNDLGLRVVT